MVSDTFHVVSDTFRLVSGSLRSEFRCHGQVLALERKIQNKLTARKGGQLIALGDEEAIARSYFAAEAAARRLAARDLRRSAVLRLITPCLTALSSVEA